MSNTDDIATELSKDFDKKIDITEVKTAVVTESVPFDWLQENEIGPLPESERRKPLSAAKSVFEEKTKQRLPSSSSKASSGGSHRRNRGSHRSCNNGPNNFVVNATNISAPENFSNDVRVTRDYKIPRIVIDPKKEKMQTQKPLPESERRKPSSAPKLVFYNKTKQRPPSSSSEASSGESHRQNRGSHYDGNNGPNDFAINTTNISAPKNFSNDVRVTRDCKIPRIVIDPKKEKMQAPKPVDEFRSRRSMPASFYPRVMMPQNGQPSNPMMGNIQYVAMPWDGSSPYPPSAYMPYGSYFVPMMPQAQMFYPDNSFMQMPLIHIPVQFAPPVRPTPRFNSKNNANNPSN